MEVRGRARCVRRKNVCLRSASFVPRRGTNGGGSCVYFVVAPACVMPVERGGVSAFFLRGGKASVVVVLSEHHL